MKPIDKKDLPKLYVLIGLAVCVLGYAIFQFTAGIGNSPASASTTKQPDAAASGGTATAANTAAAGAPAGGSPVAFDVALVGPPSGGKDPFLPIGSAKPAIGSPEAPAPPRVAIAGPQAPMTLNEIFKRFPSPVSTSPVGAVIGNKPVEVEAPPAPELTVTGVVLGNLSTGVTRNVAILRGGGGGDEDRRFVAVGDPVGNGFRVAAVHADGVDIEDSAGNRRMTLRLGKSGEDVRAN